MYMVVCVVYAYNLTLDVTSRGLMDPMFDVWVQGGGPMFDVGGGDKPSRARVEPYNEVQCIMGNGQIDRLWRD